MKFYYYKKRILLYFWYSGDFLKKIKDCLDLATENPGKHFLFTVSRKEIQFCDVPGVEIIHMAI